MDETIITLQVRQTPSGRVKIDIFLHTFNLHYYLRQNEFCNHFNFKNYVLTFVNLRPNYLLQRSLFIIHDTTLELAGTR